MGVLIFDFDFDFCSTVKSFCFFSFHHNSFIWSWKRHINGLLKWFSKNQSFQLPQNATKHQLLIENIPRNKKTHHYFYIYKQKLSIQIITNITDREQYVSFVHKHLPIDLYESIKIDGVSRSNIYYGKSNLLGKRASI